MAVVGEAIVSKIIEKLVEVGFKYVADHVAGRRRMNDELNSIKAALPRIRSAVNVAESAQQEIPRDLKDWLWQLKDAVDMAEKVLDDLDYLDIRKQVEMNVAGRSRRRDRIRRAFISYATLQKLRGAVEGLNKVAVGVTEFNKFVEEFKQQDHQTEIAPSSNREIGPALRDSNVLGRDKEMEEVLQWLMKMPDADEDHKESISLFSIVGLGGVGKTTLAQSVYRDDTLKSSFSTKIWISVSSTPFDAKKIMGDILEFVTNRRSGVVGRLEEDLVALASSNKFLLVLDDAWDSDGDFSSWEQLFAPLRSGLAGSKILLTSRSKKVAKTAARALGGPGKKPILKLTTLEKSDFLSLFNRYAFDGVNPCKYGKLETLGEKIAERLGGLPLAAKMIGVLLNSNPNESHWKNILQSPYISDDVMRVLMLSYRYLPTHLRPCFAFCSIFPRDHKFIKDNLVLMWMALGFIPQPQNEAETLEDIGSRYFDELAKRSFFEQRGMCGINPMTGELEEAYIMHHLLHDLAHKVSHDECFRFVGGTSINEIPKTIRHLHFETDDLDLLKNMDKWKNLHTLILKFNLYNDEHAVAFKQVFESLESIRVLSITAEGMEVLPEVMGKLRHLRYLSIGHRISRLPSSICKLYHLQVLACKRRNAPSVLVLKNLINLRHLRPWDDTYEKIDGIGTLTSLQRLSFPANVYELSELKDLGELRELIIRDLKNDQHDEEVSLVKLNGKKRLYRLDLCWSFDLIFFPKKYEKVLDHFHPPDSLKQLRIEGYQGARSPYWMEQESLKNLEEIVLSDNTAWEHLPSLGKLPYLNKLELRSLTALKQIDFEGGFQQLKILEIRRCPKLKALPPLPLGLKRLALKNVGLSDSPTFCLTTPSSSSPSLYHMEIGGCEKLTSVAGLLRHCLTSLEYLEIIDCEALVDLHPEEGFQHLRSIKGLHIAKCLKLNMATGAVTPIDCLPFSSLEIDDPFLLRIEPLRQLTSVRELSILDCRNLECEGDVTSWLLQNRTSLQEIRLGKYTAKLLPCSLRAVSSLRELYITDACGLQSLPLMPPSLQMLEIYGCSKTLKERCVEDEGADWPNIKHIPTIRIRALNE